MAKVSKQGWIDTGMALLSKRGSASLTLENLLAELDVTIGSFYHHFGSRKKFVDAILDHWEVEMTDSIIQQHSQQLDAKQQIHDIIESVLGLKKLLPLEISIRAWAMESDAVKKRLQRVEKKRLKFGQSIFEKIVADKKQAKTLAITLYAVFVGAQSMVPPMGQAQLAQAYRELLKGYNVFS